MRLINNEIALGSVMPVKKGLYGGWIEKHILKSFYKTTINPKNNKYDLDGVSNKVNGCNVSIKSSKNCIVYCADITNFLSTENCEL